MSTNTTNNFKPVTFESSKKTCPLPFAVTISKRDVTFRLNSQLVSECKLKAGLLMSLFYDDLASLFALVEDPENKHGEARKLHSSSSKTKKPTSLTIAFPRTDLLKRIWAKEAIISGLPLFEKRAHGKIVFHAPTGK